MPLIFFKKFCQVFCGLPHAFFEAGARESAMPKRETTKSGAQITPTTVDGALPTHCASKQNKGHMPPKQNTSTSRDTKIAKPPPCLARINASVAARLGNIHHAH